MEYLVDRLARGDRLAGLAVAVILIAAASLAWGQASTAPTQPLQLTISLDTPVITEPLAARVTLHFHNAGSKPIWLYEPVKDASQVSANPADAASGGPALAASLRPNQAGGTLSSSGFPATGAVLDTPGFPRPQLVTLAPGGEMDERAVIRIKPAQKDSNAASAIWGAYQMSVTYSARYHNGDELRRDVDVNLWHGSVSSNAVGITLRQIPAANHCSIQGVTLGHDMAPDADILVSLSDDQQHLLAQTVTAGDGGFYFDNLPPGRYWVTVRRERPTADTGFFEHADLSGSQPEARLKLIMLNEEVYDAKRLLHKPVIFRVTDKAGNPAADATLEILWTSGTVVDNVKVRTSEDGLVVASLLPGTNYVTIRKHGCAKDEEMAAVSPGGGIDGFSYSIDCSK